MKVGRITQAAFATLPPLMQLVQTFIRRTPPRGNRTRIDCRLGLKTRGVRLLACETLLPNCGPLPQTSQRLAMIAALRLITAARHQQCGSVQGIETKTYNKRTSRGQGGLRRAKYLIGTSETLLE